MERDRKDKNDDLDSLLPGNKIAGYTLCPWTLKNLKELYPTLMLVKEMFKKKEVTFANIESALTSNPELFAEAVLTHGATIISVTLGIDIEKAEGIEAGKSVEIMFSIFFMNIQLIKNSLGLVEQVKEAMTSTRP